MNDKVYHRLALALQARASCKKDLERNPNDQNKKYWLSHWTDVIEHIQDNHLPHGSGIDSGCCIDNDSVNPIIIYTAFHHMDECGGYEGWTEHTIKVYPDFISDITLKITGKNRNMIKDYLYELFYNDLTSEMTE